MHWRCPSSKALAKSEAMVIIIIDCLDAVHDTGSKGSNTQWVHVEHIVITCW
jgi:hypothetical protein